MGGAKSLPVVTISDADLEANGGQYKLTGKYAIKVNGNDSLSTLSGVPGVVYPVSQDQIASGEFELIQGRAVDVSQVSGRGQESSAWATPVYHAGPGTWPPSGVTPFVGAYDAYTDNIVEVWEVRRVLSSYTGPLVEIYRVSDAETQDFGYVAAGHLDDVAIASFLGASAGKGRTFYGQKGLYNIIQTDPDKMPVYTPNAQGGRSSFVFDNTNDFMQSGAFAAAVSQPGTAFAIGQMLSTDDFLFDGITSTNRWGLFIATGAYQYFAGAQDNNILRTNNYETFGALVNGANSIHYVSGNRRVGDLGAQTLTGVTLGARWDGTTRFLGGGFCGYMVLSGNQEAILPELELNASSYYTIPLVLSLETAGSDLNGRSYGDNRLASFETAGVEYQFMCYVNDGGHVVTAVRNNSGGDWGHWRYWVHNGNDAVDTITCGTGDDHKGVTAGIDQDGYIHIAYDHHGDALNYRKSAQTIDSYDGDFGAEASMLGTNESSVSYVVFFNAPDGTLYCMFRDGSASDGDYYFYTYDEVTGWSASVGTGTAGLLLDASTGADAPYIDTPCVDADFGSGGYMHFSGTWRIGVGGDTNQDKWYFKWDGTNFVQADGAGQTVPVTPANDEVAASIAIESGLISQASIASDDNGNPHLAYIRNDDNGDAQIYHTWHNGAAWATAAITNQTAITSTGDPENDSLRNPDIAVNQSSGRAYVLYTLFGQTGIHGFYSDDYANWTAFQVTATPTGEWSVTFDPWQWANNGVLYFPLQAFGTGAVVINPAVVRYEP